MTQPAENDPLRELVESGMTYAQAEAVHGSDCMCSWCASERMTYCALTSGMPDHPDHRLPSCPGGALPDTYPECGCQPDDCPDREGVERTACATLPAATEREAGR